MGKENRLIVDEARSSMIKHKCFSAATLLLTIGVIFFSGCFHNRALDYETAATFYKLKGEYDKAIDQYNLALESAPYDARIFNERGITYSKKGDQQKAINDFNRAIEMKKDYSIAYVNRGLAFYRAGNKNHAIEDYNKAIEIKSDTSKAILAAAYYNRGLVYSSEGNCGKAISDFDSAAQADEKSVGNLVELALMLATSPDGMCRDGARAVRLAEEALQIRKTAHILRAVAAAYAETGRFEKAVSSQEEALALLRKEKIKPISAAVDYYTKQLEAYQHSMPWREKWSENNDPKSKSQ